MIQYVVLAPVTISDGGVASEPNYWLQSSVKSLSGSTATRVNLMHLTASTWRWQWFCQLWRQEKVTCETMRPQKRAGAILAPLKMQLVNIRYRRKSRLPRTNRNQLLAPIFFHLEAADEAEALKHFQIHYRQVSLGCINALYLFAECISHLPRLTFAG